MTDDPENEKIPLTIKGKVIEIYTLSAKSVKLKGVVGEPLKATVRLTPSEAYPFKVREVTAKRGTNIKFDLEETQEDGVPGYKITVENTATEKGVYFDTLYLKTDSDKKPEIEITVVGSIREEKQSATDATDEKEG